MVAMFHHMARRMKLLPVVHERRVGVLPDTGRNNGNVRAMSKVVASQSAFIDRATDATATARK
jgi:hypothetical protein